MKICITLFSLSLPPPLIFGYKRSELKKFFQTSLIRAFSKMRRRAVVIWTLLLLASTSSMFPLNPANDTIVQSSSINPTSQTEHHFAADDPDDGTTGHQVGTTVVFTKPGLAEVILQSNDLVFEFCNDQCIDGK